MCFSYRDASLPSAITLSSVRGNGPAIREGLPANHLADGIALNEIDYGEALKADEVFVHQHSLAV
jgi:hypothetical protein